MREGRLIERDVYKIFLGLYWAFIGERRLKESGCLLEKIRYPFYVVGFFYTQLVLS